MSLAASWPPLPCVSLFVMADFPVDPEAVPVALVVDDDAVTRRVLTVILEGDGYEVVTADDAAGAVTAARTRRFDVVLLDRHLGSDNGLEVLPHLRATASNRAVPVVLVTAADDPSDVARGLEAGANDYVTKPFDRVALLARVGAQRRSRALWATDVERHFEHRSAVIARVSLLGTAPASTGAGAFCRELLALEGVQAAMVGAVAAPGVISVVGAAGDAIWPMDWRRRLPAGIAADLFRAADRGATLLSERSASGAEVAVAPVLAGRKPVGVLVLAGRAVGGISPLRHAGLLGTAADFGVAASALFGSAMAADAAAALDVAAIEAVIKDRRFTTAFQPICDLANGRVVGYEALTRFEDGTPPDVRFAAASSVGLGDMLEVATIKRAVEGARSLVEDCWVSFNVSAASVGRALDRALDRCERRVVLELTEHDRVDDYEGLRARIRRLRAAPHLSVDDAGAGFASLSHVLALEPDFMKLDRSWVTNIDQDATRQALVAGLVHFAGATGCVLIAEGVERRAELDMLRQLGVTLAQGFFLGRPAAVRGASDIIGLNSGDRTHT